MKSSITSAVLDETAEQTTTDTLLVGLDLGTNTSALLASSAKSADIRDNLEKISGFAGTSGIYTYSPDNHNGLDESAFIMVTIENGTWKLLK